MKKKAIDYKALVLQTEKNLISILGEKQTDYVMMGCGDNAYVCMQEFHPEICITSEEYEEASWEWVYMSLSGELEAINAPEEAFKAIA
jgi:anthranilate/para-aminobenzoate synthase component II